MRSHKLQSVKQRVYLAFALAVVALMFFLNYRHETKIKINRRRMVVFQEQLEGDPRFKNIALQIDTEMAVSVLSGTVASKKDLQALMDMVAKFPPFSGTHNWRFRVEISQK